MSSNVARGGRQSSLDMQTACWRDRLAEFNGEDLTNLTMFTVTAVAGAAIWATASGAQEAGLKGLEKTLVFIGVGGGVATVVNRVVFHGKYPKWCHLDAYCGGVPTSCELPIPMVVAGAVAAVAGAFFWAVGASVQEKTAEEFGLFLAVGGGAVSVVGATLVTVVATCFSKRSNRQEWREQRTYGQTRNYFHL